jgi:predicted transcriptional regulator
MKKTYKMEQSIFISKPTNDWIKEASLKPIPKMLFSEFWFESEICVIFSDTNLGKSILAVQIADSISKGVSVEKFAMEAVKQKVLYFDFELSSKQVENRYSHNYKNHYHFDENFVRTEINTESNVSINATTIIKKIESEITEQDAKIIIIDNLTYLSQDNEKGNLALDLMKSLKELKSKYSLSILVLAHTPKRDFNRPISNNDLQGSKMLMNFVDSSMAIGKSYTNTNLRYLKQIKQRNCEQIYNEENVCICEINKGAENNNLQFNFLEFDSEYNHLNYERTKSKDESKEEAKTLRLEGLNNVQIAKELEVSEGTIRNWLDK